MNDSVPVAEGFRRAILRTQQAEALLGKLRVMHSDRLSSPFLEGQMLHCHADLPMRSPTAVTHDSIPSISSRAALQCFFLYI